MARNNLSLGNLYRAVTGTARTSQAASLSTLNGGAGSNINMLGFATDAITVTPPTFTYIVESTTENAQFSFASTGSQFYNRIQSQTANFTCSFNNSNFNVSAASRTNGPSVFPINAAGITLSNYSEASATLTMAYADGFNLGATNYGASGAQTKVLYAVDVYNTINQPDFCLLFGTQIELEDGTMVNVEDVNVGDQIKSWVPVGLPDESQDIESDQVDWRFHFSNTLEGTTQNVTVKDVTFNFAEGYVSLNDGLIKATETHPLYVWDCEILKYRFKNIGDILIGDKLIMQDETEVEVINIELIREDIEIVTINVEDADVYISNGFISHNKGTTTQPPIPASGLRMYLDPSKSSSTNGTATADWLDLSGYNTGVRPRGVSNDAGITGANPAYNNGASRKEKYWTLAVDTGAGWYKDRSSNIATGSTNFDVSAMTYVTWFRLPTAFTAGDQRAIFLQKSTVGATDYGMGLNTNSAGVNYRLYWESSISTPFTSFTSSVLSLSTNVWYMASYVVSASTGMILYFDTTAVNGGATTISTFPATNAQTLLLGNQSTLNRTYQQGPSLFFNRALNSTEITQIYNHFSPTYK